MKIAIGMKIKEGPFGGGNQFGRSLTRYLTDRGHQIFFDLKEPNLDMILLTDPRSYLSSVSFGPVEILDYLRNKNSKAIVVHRVNECDERKGTHTMNKQLEIANSIADHTVYVGSWLINLFQKQGLKFTSSYTVIKNGADQTIFRFVKKSQLPQNKVRLVTHHWAANRMKGWDVYMYLDSLLEFPEYQQKFELHVIGNIPKICRPNHIFHHQSQTGQQLAQLISSCDVYLTASINEPGANHPVEGALCGLPLLYRKSGSLPEYCEGYGEMFTGVNDVLQAMERLISNYTTYAKRMISYPLTSERMCQEYEQLFSHLLTQRNELLSHREKGGLSYTRKCKMKIKLGLYRLTEIVNLHLRSI